MTKQNKKLILSSKSPRRQELLKGLGLEFSIDIREVEELYDEKIPANQVSKYLAKLKATPFIGTLASDQLLITSDTVVVIDDKVLGKPKNNDEAEKMLEQLSGKTHKVITGVCLTEDLDQHVFSVETEVIFDELTLAEIQFYIQQCQPFDKAGSYGIQEWIGFAKIKALRGCYYNVMGLPLNALYRKLQELKVI